MQGQLTPLVRLHPSYSVAPACKLGLYVNRPAAPYRILQLDSGEAFGAVMPASVRAEGAGGCVGWRSGQGEAEGQGGTWGTDHDAKLIGCQQKKNGGGIAWQYIQSL